MKGFLWNSFSKNFVKDCNVTENVCKFFVKKGFISITVVSLHLKICVLKFDVCFLWNSVDQYSVAIVWTSTPPLFWLPLPEGRGESENLKRGGNMMQGQVSLKGLGVGAPFLFNFFKVYHFYIQKFTLCKIVSCIWRKKIFFLPP